MGNQAIRQHQNDPRRHRHSPPIRYSAAAVRSKGAEPHERLAGRSEGQFVRFFRRYPLALLLAAWVTFMLLAGVAIMDMTSLGAATPVSNGADVSVPIAPSLDLSAQPSDARIQEVLPAQSTSEQSPQLQPRHNALPLLSLVAIAISCAVGCMIILQVLKPRRPPERSHSSVFSKPAVASNSALHRFKASDKQANSRFQAVPHQAPSQQTLLQAHSASASALTPSVVPPNVSQPLDWEEPSLADNMDLRQHRPLSYWL